MISIVPFSRVADPAYDLSFMIVTWTPSLDAVPFFWLFLIAMAELTG
jgi:hypothetical protein